jgi:hypothetical protein
VVRLLKLSALALMSHPFGAQLANWTTEWKSTGGATGPKRPLIYGRARAAPNSNGT